MNDFLYLDAAQADAIAMQALQTTVAGFNLHQRLSAGIEALPPQRPTTTHVCKPLSPCQTSSYEGMAQALIYMESLVNREERQQPYYVVAGDQLTIIRIRRLRDGLAGIFHKTPPCNGLKLALSDLRSAGLSNLDYIVLVEGLWHAEWHCLQAILRVWEPLLCGMVQEFDWEKMVSRHEYHKLLLLFEELGIACLNMFSAEHCGESPRLSSRAHEYAA
jgi:hypothetical protein